MESNESIHNHQRAPEKGQQEQIITTIVDLARDHLFRTIHQEIKELKNNHSANNTSEISPNESVARSISQLLNMTP